MTGFGQVPAEGREDPPAHRALTGSVLALLIIWTLLGNFAVCAAVGRYRHLRAKVTNIFIVSLALSDLLVAVLVMPWKAVAEVVGFWPFGAFCKTWLSFDIMCSTASILNLCVISVDRYWAISSPFRYERTMDRKACGGHARSCRSDAAEPFAHLCSEISANSYQPHVRVRSNSLRFNHVELKVSIRKETKVLKTLSVIMGVFVCCWLPFFVLNCALPFCPASGASAGAQRRALCVGEKTFDVFVWIGWSNSSLNPIIYAFNADFRDAFLRLLRWRRSGCCPAACAATETAISVHEGGQ
ncbi:unnamed protein product, partial [Tetraodon nigroviridis]